MNDRKETTSSKASTPWPVALLVLLFFLLSGASGLIYEVIWTRVLLTVFGATLYAVATVLAAFMGGLALGGLLGGRVADRHKAPLRLYGILEIIIAIAALAVPWALGLFDPLYRAVYASGDVSFLKLSLLRFALSFFILLIPTTCMGATLPLLSRFLARRTDNLGGRIGGLYAVNTTGAVIGAFLAGFVLIARLGVPATIQLAAAISALVGVAALLLSLKLESKTAIQAAEDEAQKEPEAPVAERPDADALAHTPPWLVRLVLATYAVSGFVALSYQVLWTRALVFRFEFLKNTTYSFTAMLTVFLIGLAAGSALMALRVDRQRTPVRLYGLIQILIGLSGAFSLFVLIHYIDFVPLFDPLDTATGNVDWVQAVFNIFLKTFATLGIPTFLMGMAFPVAAKICVPHLKSVGSGTGRLYAVNTLGAILGSFAAGFILIPLFGLARGFLVLGLANVILGAVVLIANPHETAKHKQAWVIGSLVILGFFFLRLPQTYYFQPLEPGHSFVTLGDEKSEKQAYIEGPLATVAVIENSIGDRTISVDNASVAGTDQILLTDQKSLAHVPALLLENPESALTVGFGSGGASWSYLLYDELKQVDCIEICQTVPQVASSLRASNHGVLDEWDGKSQLAGQKFHNGRYRVIIDDARSYLRFTDTRYDIIATDCTDLRYKSNANLYDVEYFDLCKKALTDDGMVVVWMPLAGMSEEVFACALRTFVHVFPNMTVWYMNNQPTHYLLLLGTDDKKPKPINIARMRERIARKKVAADLAEISLDQPEKILSCFLGSAADFQGELDRLGDILNREQKPFIEFESPKFGYTEEPLFTNLEMLLRNRTSILPHLEDKAAHPKFIERLKRFEDSVDDILAGHNFYRHLELEEACKKYLAAARLAPEDHSLEYLLDFDELQRIKKRVPDPRTPWAPVIWIEGVRAETRLAAIDVIKKKFDSAVAQYNKVLSKTEGISDKNVQALRDKALLGMGRCYLGLGNYARGLRYLDEYADSLGEKAEFKELRKEFVEKLEK